MVKIKEAIVVEGRYDKNTLRQIVDTAVFTTEGFGVMNDKTKLDFLRTVAESRGLIVLTDSDGAGFVIRNHLKGALPKDKVRHAYIPDVMGKEKRKAVPGKEGKLGVEGMDPATLLTALKNAGATFLDDLTVGAAIGRPRTATANQITKTDLFELGLSGGADSKARRKSLQKKLGFPEKISTNAFLQAVNLLYTVDDLKQALEKDNG